MTALTKKGVKVIVFTEYSKKCDAGLTGSIPAGVCE